MKIFFCCLFNSLIIREFDQLKAQKKFWAQWSTVKNSKRLCYSTLILLWLAKRWKIINGILIVRFFLIINLIDKVSQSDYIWWLIMKSLLIPITSMYIVLHISPRRAHFLYKANHYYVISILVLSFEILWFVKQQSQSIVLLGIQCVRRQTWLCWDTS